jgi:hypothetical protein
VEPSKSQNEENIPKQYQEEKTITITTPHGERMMVDIENPSLGQRTYAKKNKTYKLMYKN